MPDAESKLHGEPVSLAHLARHLGGIYDEDRSKVALQQAGIAIASMPFSGRGTENWTGILVEVKRLGRLDSLFQGLQEDYPDDEALARAVELGVIGWPVDRDPPPETGNLLWDLVKIGPVLLAPGLTLWGANLETEFWIAMGDGTPLVFQDSGFGRTLLRSAFSGSGWLLSSALMVAVLVIITLLLLSRWGKLAWSPEPRVRLAACGFVVGLLVVVLGVAWYRLPQLQAAERIEGVLTELAFGGEFPSHDGVSELDRDGSRRWSAVLYSWLLGVHAEVEPPSPDGVLPMASFEVGPPTRWAAERVVDVSTLQRARDWFRRLARQVGVTYLVLLLCTTIIVLLGQRMSGRQLFLPVLLLVGALVLSTFLLFLARVSYARVFLVAGALERLVESRQEAEAWRPIREWPFPRLYVTPQSLSAAQETGRFVPVRNFWPIRGSAVQVGLACTWPPTPFPGWEWLGTEIIYEASPTSGQRGIVVDLAAGIRQACCTDPAARSNVRQLKISDGLGASAPVRFVVDCR